MTNLDSIPEVTLTDEQAERAYQLKARWERPNRQLLVPLTLTRYIVYLQDELSRLTVEPTPKPLGVKCPGCGQMLHEGQQCGCFPQKSTAQCPDPYCNLPEGHEGDHDDTPSFAMRTT